MILADTSVWIDHLRSNDPRLARSLEQGRVLTHPFVIGELALGRLAQRTLILALLQDLPKAATASDAEVLGFIEAADLSGQGIGYVDAHLLAAVRLTPNATLWTRDRKLDAVAGRLGMAAALQ